MTANEHLSEYKAFLKWFEASYPALFKLHCRDILPAVSDAGIVINRRNIDTDSYQMLVQMVGEYYWSIKNK